MQNGKTVDRNLQAISASCGRTRLPFDLFQNLFFTSVRSTALRLTPRFVPTYLGEEAFSPDEDN
jgi:hypothetical protein